MVIAIGVFMCPHAAHPRRLCQPPWTQPSLSENDRTLRRNQLRRKAHPKRQPLFGREGSGGEGKDSHSRQWRLSMAVFLNRNKRPKAAPIEVAELLSEKPPLPPESPPPSPHLSGREREGGGLSEERPPPSIFIYPYFPAAVNVPTSTEEEPTPLAGKIKSLPMARMFLSTS